MMSAPRVLVADDDPVLLDLMVRRIGRMGFQADRASDGRAALVLLKRTRYDLVVTDIYMPGASGLDLLQEAKARDPNLQVIVITAAATLENAVQALNTGAFSYLTKPFDHLSVFDSAVNRALEFRRLTLENLRMAEIQRRRGDLLEAEVTDRIQQLRNSQRELLDLLAAIPEGIVVISAEGKIHLTNPTAERWLAREWRSKERPIQAFLQKVLRGEPGQGQSVSLQGHPLRLRVTDLPMQDDKRRLALIIQDEFEAKPGVPLAQLKEAVLNIKRGLAWMFRHHPEEEEGKVVMYLAAQVSGIEKLVNQTETRTSQPTAKGEAPGTQAPTEEAAPAPTLAGAATARQTEEPTQGDAMSAPTIQVRRSGLLDKFASPGGSVPPSLAQQDQSAAGDDENAAGVALEIHMAKAAAN